MSGLERDAGVCISEPSFFEDILPLRPLFAGVFCMTGVAEGGYNNQCSICHRHPLTSYTNPVKPGLKTAAV